MATPTAATKVQLGVALGLSLFTSNLMLLTTTSSASDVGDFFNVPESWLDYMPVVSSATYIAFTFLAANFLPTAGLKRSLTINASLVLVATVLRVVSALLDYKAGFYVMLASNILTAIGYPWIQNSIGHFSLTWCPPNQWARGTGSVLAMGNLGSAVGFLLCTIIMTDDTRLRWGGLNVILAFFATVSLIVVLTVVQDEPVTPASQSATKQKQLVTTLHDISALKVLFAQRPPSFWLAAGLFVLTIGGVSWPFEITQTQVWQSFGFAHTDVVIGGSVFLFASVFGMGLMALTVDETRQWRVAGLGLTVASFACMLILTVLLPTSSSVDLPTTGGKRLAGFLLALVLGFTLGGLQAVALEYTLQQAFELVPTVISSTIVFLFAQVVMLIFTVVNQYISRFAMMIVMTVLLAVAVAMSWFAFGYMSPRQLYEETTARETEVKHLLEPVPPARHMQLIRSYRV